MTGLAKLIELRRMSCQYPSVRSGSVIGTEPLTDVDWRFQPTGVARPPLGAPNPYMPLVTLAETVNWVSLAADISEISTADVWPLDQVMVPFSKAHSQPT